MRTGSPLGVLAALQLLCLSGTLSTVVPLGQHAVATESFLANLQGKIGPCDPAAPTRRLVIASTGNSITSAGYISKDEQFVEVLAQQLRGRLNLNIEHRNLGVPASNCGYNWLCTRYQGDEDIIIDANPMKWSRAVRPDTSCEDMVQSELSMPQRPVVVSMDVSFPKGHIEENRVDRNSLAAQLLPYANESLVVVRTADFLWDLHTNQGLTSYYHDDIHPSAAGHRVLGNMLYELIVEASCSWPVSVEARKAWASKPPLDSVPAAGRGHCVLAKDFSIDRTRSSGVVITDNVGWSLAHRGVVAHVDSTAGILRDSKYSWMGTSPGSMLELKINASSICMVYYTNLYRMGKVDIYLDGSVNRTQHIDGYFEGYSWNRSRGLNNMRWVGKHPRLSRKEHTVKVMITNRSNEKIINPKNEFQIIAVLYFL